MRWPSPFRDRTKGIELQLTPLIDCVFLLMVYFIWSSSFAVAEKMLPGELSASRANASASAMPEAPPPPDADFADLVVRITRVNDAPAWSVNGQGAATRADLRAVLSGVAAIKPDAPIILDSDPEVPLGDVIDVFDLARTAGFTKVQFTASLPD